MSAQCPDYPRERTSARDHRRSQKCQKETCRSLLNNLVGNGEQAPRNDEAERLGGPDIDEELEFCGLDDRDIGGLGALEDAASVDPSLTIGFRNAGAVAHQPTARHELTPLVDRRKRVPCGESKHLYAAVVEHRISGDEQCIHAL